MTREETATRLVVLQWLLKQLSQVNAEARAELGDWPAKTRAVAALPDGTAVGTVTITQGRESLRVTDEARFLEWVKDNRPDQVETVERVHKAYRTHVLDDVKQTGELPPGVEYVLGDPTPRVLMEPGADVAIGDAWRTGAIGWTDLPQIEAP